MQANTIDKSEFLAERHPRSGDARRRGKPFNLLVTKICYLLNCAIKNENEKGRSAEPRSILIYHKHTLRQVGRDRDRDRDRARDWDRRPKVQVRFQAKSEEATRHSVWNWVRL